VRLAMSGAVPNEGGGAAEDGQAQSDTGHQECFGARAHGVRLRNACRLPLIRSVSADRRKHCPLGLGCRRKRGAALGAETGLCLRSCTAFRTELHASFFPVRQGTCAGRP
jgi:hypothetical protein